MANDIWTGNGDWTGNPTFWSQGSPPGTGQTAEILIGNVSLTTAGTTQVRSVIVDNSTTLNLGTGVTLHITAGISVGGTFNATSNNDTVTIAGTLSITGTANFGNQSNTPITVQAANLANNGTLSLLGGTTTATTLKITGSSASTWTGRTYLSGDVNLNVQTAVTALAKGAVLEIGGTKAQFTLGASSGGESAITGLATNAGLLSLRGDTFSNAGVSLTTTTALNNSGTFYVDSEYSGEGGSTVTLGGALTNSGTASFGNTALSGATTVTTSGLVNSGFLAVQGTVAGTTNYLSTFYVSGASSATVSGAIRVGGDADLALTTAITAINYKSSLEIDGSSAFVSVGKVLNQSGLVNLATNNGTFNLRGNTGLGSGGATVSTAGAFTNGGTLFVDGQFGGDGGSTLHIGGTFTNNGNTVVGNSSLSGASVVTANGLVNNGSLTLQGATSGTTLYKATLSVSGATAATTTGSTRIGGNADLALQTAITSIGAGSTFELDGASAFVSIGAGTSNSALSTLSSNDGTLILRGNAGGNGVGGVNVTTNAGLAFNNSASLFIDSLFNGEGGSTVGFGGRFTNAGTTQIGNAYLSANTNVTATGLINNGTLSLFGTVPGNQVSNAKAVLNITGATSSTTSGSTQIGGTADLQLQTAITSIGAGSTFELDGANAFASIGAATSNTALGTLATVAGTLILRGNSGSGTGGVTLTTTRNLNVTNRFYIDALFNGEGGSHDTIGGTLTIGGAGTVNIGNTSLSAATNVTMVGLQNNGTLTLYGTVTGNQSTVSKATLTVTGQTAISTTGSTQIGGSADLILQRVITTIGAGSSFELDGASAFASLGPDTTSNSALANLSTVAGTLVLRGNTGSGAGGVTLMTTPLLNNTGIIDVDGRFNGEGGSTVGIGGTLTNTGTLNIGNAFLSADTNMTVSGFNNQGNLNLLGTTAGASSNNVYHQATLSVTGGTSVTTTGNIYIAGDADLALKTGISGIGAGLSFELDGSMARVSLGSAATNTGLNALSSNAGTMILRGSNGYGAGPTVATTKPFTNSGTLYVDAEFNGDGGSTFSTTGTLTNSGTFAIGNSFLGAATNVSTNVFNNTGTFSIAGSSTVLAKLTATSNVQNSGTFTLGGGAEVDISGASGFVQQAGTATIAGLLVTPRVFASGGLIDFQSALTNGNGTGSLLIGQNGAMAFDAGVDSSHTVTFQGSSGGTLILNAAPSFAGVIAGFSGSDAIDLTNTTVTGLAYAGNATAGTLTVTKSGGATETLSFSGSYTTASFSTASDGRGGTLILDPPTVAAAVAPAVQSRGGFGSLAQAMSEPASASLTSGAPTHHDAGTALAPPHVAQR